MLPGHILLLLPALAACSSFKTIITDSPLATLLHLDSLPEDAHLARRALESSNERRQGSSGGCGLAQVDCGNGYCCVTASTCAMQDGKTVCLPGGVSFAQPQPAFRASMDPLSPVTPSTPSQTPLPSLVNSGESGAPAVPIQSVGTPEPLSGPTEVPSSAEGGRPSGPDSGGSSLSGGAIAGIVVGVVIAVLIVVGVIGFMMFRARKRDRLQFDEPASTNGASPATKTAAPLPELDSMQRSEMEGTKVDGMGKAITPSEPQEMMGTIPVSEKTG